MKVTAILFNGPNSELDRKSGTEEEVRAYIAEEWLENLSAGDTIRLIETDENYTDNKSAA